MKRTSLYLHLTPLVLAIFPILSLALENIEYINFSSILRPIFFSILTTAIFYVIFYLILRNPIKSGILSGILVFLLLTYGNVYIFLQARLGETVDHPYLMGIYAVVIVLAGAFFIYKLKNAEELNLAIFYASLIIVAYLLISIGIYEYNVNQAAASSERSDITLKSSSGETGEEGLPDIYLILIDGHTRSDVLRDVYGYDNSEFVSQLENLGFSVADCSKSNYPITFLTVNALFEMNYLHKIYKDYDNLVLPPLNNTSVFQILSNHNYSTVTFQNFVFEHFDIRDDTILSKEEKSFGSITEFEKRVVDNSILRILIDKKEIFPYSWVSRFDNDFYLTHYRDTVFALDTLPELPNMDGNNFVYAHLLATHDPFVFMPDGTYNPSNERTPENYRKSVEFIDTALPGIVAEIINNSKEPPIIIIMGDHGATLKVTPIEERTSILLAVYLQGEEPADFYEEISPVNVFRMIFNYLFDANYELLDDNSYDIWTTDDLGNFYKRVPPTCNP